jgi:hypothetical protein
MKNWRNDKFMNEKMEKHPKKEAGKDEEYESKLEKYKRNLPFCRTAPDPEHHRASENDEPCDDTRTGKIVKKTSH